MSEPTQGRADSVYIHLDLNLHPDLKIDPDMPLAGEGFWCVPQGDGTYIVDNLLSTTLDVGYGDRIRCRDQGTEWGAREFAEVIHSAICARAVIAPPEHIDRQHYSTFMHEVSDHITRHYLTAKIEGGAGAGLLCAQVGASEATEFMDWLKDSGYPHMAAGWIGEGADGER